MKNRKTFYHLVLDRSGSMTTCWKSTISALTDQMIKIRQMDLNHPEQEIYVSLCIFDNQIEFPFGVTKCSNADFSILENLSPRGNTALFDAIGESIRQIDFVAGDSLSRQEASVVMLVLTDGHENASTRYSSSMIRKEMDKLRATDLWTFAFIGADFDITATAETFNADKSSQMNASKKNMHEAFASVNENLDSYWSMKKIGKIKKNLFGE